MTQSEARAPECLAIAIENYRRTRTNPEAVQDVCREYGLLPLDCDTFLDTVHQIGETLFPWSSSSFSDNLHSQGMTPTPTSRWITQEEPRPVNFTSGRVWAWSLEQAGSWILRQLCYYHCGWQIEATMALLIHRFTCGQDPEE